MWMFRSICVHACQGFSPGGETQQAAGTVWSALQRERREVWVMAQSPSSMLTPDGDVRPTRLVLLCAACLRVFMGGEGLCRAVQGEQRCFSRDRRCEWSD